MRIASLVALLTCGLSVPAPANTLYTRIDEGSCTNPSPDIEHAYEARGLKVEECRAPPGYRVFLVSSDARSWLDIRTPGSAWSAEQAVVYDRPIGNFPNVGGSKVIEWRRCSGNARWTLTFRVTAQRPDDPARSISSLYVVSVGDKGIALAGRAATNGQARALADRACRE